MNRQHLWQLPRLQRLYACFVGVVSLLLLRVVLRSCQPRTALPPTIIDSVAQELGHPTFPDIRFYERNLPQHKVSTLPVGADRPRYLFFPQASRGSGWNTILQEQLLNTHLAHLSRRAYVFPAYIARDYPPFPDTLASGARHLLHIPMNAFVSGPTGGGPLSSDGKDSLPRRAVSEEWWNVVCPRTEVMVVDMHDTMRDMRLRDTSDGEERMTKWATKLLNMTAPCVSVVGGPVFDYVFIGSKRVLSLWPSYGDSPTLKYFAWSPLITAALFRNFHLLSSNPRPQFLAQTSDQPNEFQSFPPYNSSAQPIAGLLGIHLRRGDFEQHCVSLVNAGADYNAWNQLGTPGISPRPAPPGFHSSTPPDYAWPVLPDYLDIPEGQSRRDAALDHCWPSPETIVSRVNSVQESAASGVSFPRQNLRRIYIATDGAVSWVADVKARLRAEGWDVSSTADMKLTLEESAVAQAVDMSVLTAAESFIGAGFSALTSNVVQIRLAGGRDPGTIHFW